MVEHQSSSEGLRKLFFRMFPHSIVAFACGDEKNNFVLAEHMKKEPVNRVNYGSFTVMFDESLNKISYAVANRLKMSFRKSCRGPKKS